MSLEFSPHLIRAGVESAKEFGVFNAAAQRWIECVDGKIAYQSTHSPKSLRDSFPDEPLAGTEEFAYRLRNDILSGHDVLGMYPLAISNFGFDQIGVFAFNIKRDRMIDCGMKIRRLEGRGTLFDMQGPRSQLRTWKEDYLRLNPAAIITTLEGGPEPLIRVWHSN